MPDKNDYSKRPEPNHHLPIPLKDTLASATALRQRPSSIGIAQTRPRSVGPLAAIAVAFAVHQILEGLVCPDIDGIDWPSHCAHLEEGVEEKDTSHHINEG